MRRASLKLEQITPEEIAQLSLSPLLAEAVDRVGRKYKRAMAAVRPEALMVLLNMRPLLVRSTRGRGRPELVAGLVPYLLAREHRLAAWQVRVGNSREAELATLAELHLWWRLESLWYQDHDEHLLRSIYDPESPLSRLLGVEKLRSTTFLGEYLGLSHETVRKRLMRMGLWQGRRAADHTNSLLR